MMVDRTYYSHSHCWNNQYAGPALNSPNLASTDIPSLLHPLQHQHSSNTSVPSLLHPSQHQYFSNSYTRSTGNVSEIVSGSSLPMHIANESMSHKTRIPASNCQQNTAWPYQQKDASLRADPETSSAQEKVNNWLAESGLAGSLQSGQSERQHLTNTSLLDIKVMLHKLRTLQLRLQEISDEGNSPNKSDNQSEIQRNVEVLLSVLEDNRIRECVRTRLAASRKRKARRLKQKERLQEEFLAKQKQIADSHNRIDKWLNDIQESKKTELMLKAADQSMSGVRQKIVDVARQKELIQSLTKLRAIRNQQAHGMTMDTEDANKTFTKKTSELMKLLERRLELYKKEENTLKVMLASEQEETRTKEAQAAAVRRRRQHEKREKQKELWLFGPQDVSAELKPFYKYYTLAETDLESFVRIRREWDSYIVPEHTFGSSRIPHGWVIPPEPSSDLWKLYASQNQYSDGSQATGHSNKTH